MTKKKRLPTPLYPRIQLSASDPDASGLSTQHSALRYFSDFLPGGATLDPATGVFEWTPGYTQAGTYRVPFSVQGAAPLPPGSDPAPVTTVWTTVTVMNVNAAPQFDQIGDLEILENQTLFIRTFAFDPDNPGFIPQDRLFDGTLTPLEGTDPTVTYTITGLPPGATFDPVSAQLSWLPTFDQAGTYLVTVTATDEGTGSAPGAVPVPGLDPVPLTSSVTIPITVVNVNRPPVLPDLQNQVVNRGETLDLPVTATDADGNPLTLIAVSGEGQLVPEEAPLPRFATFIDHGDGTGLFHFAPTVGDRGNYTITLYATDNGDPTPLTPDPLPLTALETFVVQVNSPSEPPVLQYVGNQVAVVGQPLSFTVRATDLDQDPLTFTLTGLPSNATITPGVQYGTAVVSWTPTSEQLGAFPVTIRVTDNGNHGAVGGTIGFDERTITIVSRVTNQSPVLQPIGEQTAAERQPFTLQLVATDADGDQLTFSGTNLPAGSTLDPVTGLFTWTPTFNQAGTYDGIRFTVSDGNKSQSETIRVTVANTNRPPTVIPLTAQSGREQARLNFTIAAADLDAESLTFSSLTSLPAGAHFDGKTGEFEWTPDFTQAGTYTFTFQAQDPSGATGTTDVTVRIADVNRPPVLSLTNHQVLIGQEAVFQLAASDPDSPPSPDVSRLTFHAVGLPDGATLDPTNGLFRWTPGIGQIGDYLMLVTVSDGQATTTDSFVLRAGTELQTPHVQIDLTPSFPVVPGQKVLASVLASGLAEIVSTTIMVQGSDPVWVPVPFDHLGRAVITAAGPGELIIRATATDADGVTGTTETVLKIKNPDDKTAPILAFDGAVPGMVVRDASAIRATILDSDLDSWTLEIAHATSDAFTLLASGNTPILSTQHSALVTLDPSGYSNGFYRLRLTAQDVAGRRAETEALIEVNSAVKTGQFTHHETDLTVTLDGHVFNLVRQYDSLTSVLSPQSSALSFGNGWRLANRDLYLETNASPAPRGVGDAGLTPDSSPAFRTGTRLYLTLPDGERVGYTFTPERHTVNGVTFYTPVFTPDASPLTPHGWTLSAASTKLTKAGEHVYDFLTGEAYNPTAGLFGGGGLSGFSGTSGASALSPQSSVLSLTSPDGTRYEITAQGQIGEEIRPDGARFFWSDSGLTAVSTGETVQFTWTAVSSSGPNNSVLSPQHSALSSITGPDGHRVVYTYDQQGQLVSARDLITGETSRYGYTDSTSDPNNSQFTTQHSKLILITHTGQPGSVIDYSALSPQSSVLQADLGAALTYLQTPYQGTLEAGATDQLVFAVRPSEIVSTNSGDVYIGVIVDAEGTDPFTPAAPVIQGLTPLASNSTGSSAFGLYRIERDGLYLLNVSNAASSASSESRPYRVTLFIAGDANRDTKVDGTDATLIEAALGATTGGANYSADADANQDGVIDSSDLHLYRQDLGFIPNQAPALSAVEGPVTTHIDLEVLKSVQQYISDAENDPTIYRIVGATNGTARIASNGTSVSFTPTTGYSGPASFSIVADDGYATSQVATVTVNVSDAPLVSLDFTIRQPRLDARHSTTLELVGDFTDEQDVRLPASYLNISVSNPSAASITPHVSRFTLHGLADGTTGIVTASTAHGPNGAVIQAATAFMVGWPTTETDLQLFFTGLVTDPTGFSLSSEGGQRQVRVGYDDTFSLTATTTGTQYLVSNPTVLQVDDYGLVSAVGEGEAVLTILNGPAELLIPVRVESPHVGPTTLGTTGGVVKSVEGYQVAVAPGALPDAATVSIAPLTQADLSLTIPGPFEYVAAFDLEVGEAVLAHPLQLAIPVSPTLAPGTQVYFFQEGNVPDATGAARPVWMQMEVGVVGDDGIARTTSYPSHGVDRSGRMLMTTVAPGSSIAQVVGKVNVTYTYPPTLDSNFLAFASLGGGAALGAFASLDASLALITMHLPVIPNLQMEIVEVTPEGDFHVTATTLELINGNELSFPPLTIYPAPPTGGELWSDPFITGAGLNATSTGIELVLTGDRFTYAHPNAPADKQIGSRIEDLEIHFLQDGDLPEIVVHPLATSTDTEVRVAIPQTVTFGLSSIQVKRPQYLQKNDGTWVLVKKASNTVRPERQPDHYLYAALGGTNQVAVISVLSDTLIARVPVGGPTSNPRAVTFTPDNSRAYVTLRGERGIAVVDNTTLQQVDVNAKTEAIDTIPVSGTPFWAVVDPHGDYLYVSDEYVGTISVIAVDPRDDQYHQVVKQISVTATDPYGLRGLDINADGTRLYVAAPGKGSFGDKQHDTGEILVIDTDANSENKWTQIGRIKAGQEPYGVKASPTDPREITFTNRRSDSTGFTIIRANDSQTEWNTRTSVPMTLGPTSPDGNPLPPKDNFDLNNASGITILKAGTLTDILLPNGQLFNQTKDYAFVTGWNQFKQGVLSHDPYLAATLTPAELASLKYDLSQPVGGNVGVIEDPFGTFGKPTLIAATKPTMESFPDNLDLSLDGTMLYAAYRSNQAVQIFDVEEILATIAQYRDVQVNTATGQGLAPKLSVTPLDDLNPLVAAGYIVTGGLPQGVKMDADVVKATLGFGHPDNPDIVDAPVAGDTTPLFRWKLTMPDGKPIPDGWVAKVYVSTFRAGLGLFPEDVRDRSGNDLHQNRIVNGVEAVRSQDDPYLFELDLNSVMGRKLTLGQDYRYGVKLFKVVNGQEIPQPVVANSIKFHLDAAPVPAERGNTFSSVTMITHGFQTQLASIAQNFKSKVLGGPGGEHSLLNEGQWIIQMADQIVEAGGGEKNSNVLLYQKDSGEWRPLPGRGIVASPVAGKPLVLISDWWTESDINDSGFSEAAGDALFASLVNFDKSQGGKIFNSPLHFWSHSRGTIVTSEILQRLGEYENRFLSQQATYHPLDIQFTTLDVHDEFYGPQTNLTPLGIDWTDFNEPSVYAWSNVDFADNYYQILSARQPTIPSTAFPFFASASPDGRLLPSADLNWQFGGRDYQGLTGFLTDDATASHGYVGPHSRMWRWYAGTTDLSVDTFDAYTEPIFRSQADIERFKDLGGGGNLPWYVPQTASATYYDQPGLTTAVLNATWEGIDVGWWYSELGGGKSERPTGGQRVALFTDNTAAGETKVTPELTVWSDSKIPTLFNGDFEAGNMQRDSRVYAFGGGGRKVSTPGWAYHQDPTIGNTDGFVTRDVKIEPYTLLNGSVGHAAELSSSRVTQLVHNRFYIPMEAQFVQLKYLVKEVEYGRDSTGSQVPRLPNIDVLVRIGTDEYRLGTIPTSSDSLLPFQTTPQMSLISAVNVKTGATRDLRREVGELIIRLTFDANAPTFITGQTTRARVWIDDVRLGPTGAALQADPVDHTTATMTTLHLTNLTSLLETSKLIWGSGFDYIEPPNGVIGLTLGDQQGLTTLHSTPEQGNLDEHGSTGSGEGGLDDQCLFESSSTTLKFVGENQSAAAAGTFPLVEGLAGATAETDQIRGDGHPALAADSHAVQAQGDAGLLEGQQATLLPAVRNEPVSDHAPVGHDGAFIGEGAVLIPHNQLGGDPASGGGDGAVTNLNILQLQQLTLEPLIFLNDFCPVGGGPEGPGSILAAARLNETDEQQGQSIVSHDPSFGTPTLPPDRRFVNSSDGLSGFSGLSSAGASSGPNNSQLTTQNSTLSPEQLSLLGRATIAIDDLPDGYLALTLGTTITLDTDAAGYGWFIDPTPGVHEEFDYTPLSSEALAKEDSSPWQLQAAPGSAAEGKIDLMTVLMHELGHVMGLGHVSSAVDGTRLMAGAIDPGIRRLPSALDLGPEPSSDPNHSVLSPQSSSLDVWDPYLAHYTTTQSSDLSPQPACPEPRRRIIRYSSTSDGGPGLSLYSAICPVLAMCHAAGRLTVT